MGVLDLLLTKNFQQIGENNNLLLLAPLALRFGGLNVFLCVFDISIDSNDFHIMYPLRAACSLHGCKWTGQSWETFHFYSVFNVEHCHFFLRPSGVNIKVFVL